MSEELPRTYAIEVYQRAQRDLSQTDVVLSAEVVDGEVVRDGGPDFEWEQWWDPDRAVTHYKLQVSKSWYQRVAREDWAELNALLGGLAELQRRTRRPGDSGPRVAT